MVLKRRIISRPSADNNNIHTHNTPNFGDNTAIIILYNGIAHNDCVTPPKHCNNILCISCAQTRARTRLCAPYRRALAVGCSAHALQILCSFGPWGRDTADACVQQYDAYLTTTYCFTVWNYNNSNNNSNNNVLAARCVHGWEVLTHSVRNQRQVRAKDAKYCF